MAWRRWNIWKLKRKPTSLSQIQKDPYVGEHLSSEAIREANKEVKLVVSKESSKCSPYLKATPEQKAIIGKYAAENGIVRSIQRFQKDFFEWHA